VHRNHILIYIQQDATLHSLFYLETALNVSGGTTAHHQEHKQLYLQHLVFVTQLLLSAAIVKELELVAVDTVFCAPDDGWRYHQKYVKQFPDKINCIMLHLFGYILEYALTYLCNLTRYWLQAPWWWYNSVETCSSSIIICQLIVHWLDIVQNKKRKPNKSWKCHNIWRFPACPVSTVQSTLLGTVC
jgi:hypothetical protein